MRRESGLPFPLQKRSPSVFAPTVHQITHALGEVLALRNGPGDELVMEHNEHTIGEMLTVPEDHRVKQHFTGSLKDDVCN